METIAAIFSLVLGLAFFAMGNYGLYGCVENSTYSEGIGWKLDFAFSFFMLFESLIGMIGGALLAITTIETLIHSQIMFLITVVMSLVFPIATAMIAKEEGETKAQEFIDGLNPQSLV